MVGKEARAPGSLKEELPDCPAVVSSQLLYQLRQKEGHLQAHPHSACPALHMQAVLRRLCLKYACRRSHMPRVQGFPPVVFGLPMRQDTTLLVLLCSLANARS